MDGSGGFWLSNRAPRKPLILWSARAAILALTIAIPVTTWVVLHGPPTLRTADRGHE